MWTRFAFVVLLSSCAGCATLLDGPAPKPTKADQQAYEEELFSHMQMSTAPIVN